MTKSKTTSTKRKRLVTNAKRKEALRSFGSLLRQMREQKGYSPTEFSRISKLDLSNLHKYESGTREPGLILILLIAETLEVNPLALCNARLTKGTIRAINLSATE